MITTYNTAVTDTASEILGKESRRKNPFPERIMSNALDKHDGNISVGGRTTINLRFADDSDAFTEEEQERQ